MGGVLRSIPSADPIELFYDTCFSKFVNKHDELCPKGSVENRGRSRRSSTFPRDLVNLMNDKIMFDSYYCINEEKNIDTPCRRNLVLTALLALAIGFWMLPRYIPEHFGFFPKFNDNR